MRLAGNSSIGVVLTTLICVTLFAQSSVVLGQQDTADKPVVLKNATIYSMGADGTFVGSILVIDGKISAIGTDDSKFDIPDDATEYDLTGCYITPGLIESRSKLWLTAGAGNEGNTKAELNAVDAIDPWSKDWQELASQGITSVYVQPASSGLLGGYGAVLRVGPASSKDEIVLKGEAAVQAAIGVNTPSSQTRHTQIGQLEKLLTDTKAKMEKDEKDDKKEASSTSDRRRRRPGGRANRRRPRGNDRNDKDKEEKKDGEDKGGDKDDDEDEEKEDKDKKDSDKDSKDAEKKDEKLTPATIALRKVLKKELPLFVEVRHSDSLQKVLKLAEKFEIRVVVDGLGRSASGIDKLVESGLPMVVGPLLGGTNTGNQVSKQDPRQEWLPSIGDSPFSLSGFARSARSSRMLRSQAAMAIRMGLDHDDVMAAITSNPARSLGIGNQVGTLETGKSADIAVFAGDPLDPCTRTRLVISQGRVTFESEVEKANPISTAKAIELPQRLPRRYAVKTTRMLRDGKLTAGTITVQDGKIVSVSDKDSDEDVQLFDLGDTIITPGLVMANSTLGQQAAIVDTNDSDTSHLRAVDAIDPGHEFVKRALQGGFVHVGVSPGTANTSPGVMGHARLGAREFIVAPAIASQFVLQNSARRNGRYPSSFNGQLRVINDLMEGQPLPSSVYMTQLMQDLLAEEKTDNIKAVSKGDRPAVLVAGSTLEIRSAIGLVKERGLRGAILTNGRVGEFAEQLSENKIGIIVPSLNGSEFDTQMDQIIMAQQAGVALAFAGESPDGIRLTAALLVSHGLDPQAALQGLTEGGGQLAGMQDSGLTKGAHADFVVWSDMPLNLAARPLNVIVDGQVVSQK